MLKFLICFVLVCFLLIIGILVADPKIEKLDKNNRFRKWWKDHVVGDDIYGF